MQQPKYPDLPHQTFYRHRLFAFSIGDENYYVVADLVGTPHFVVRGKGGEAFKRILRSPFGTLISETAEEFRVPLGFHGGVEDVSGSGAVLISGGPPLCPFHLSYLMHSMQNFALLKHNWAERG